MLIVAKIDNLGAGPEPAALSFIFKAKNEWILNGKIDFYNDFYKNDCKNEGCKVRVDTALAGECQD